MRQIVGDYGRTFTDADLTITKGFLKKSRAFAFESADAKLGLLATIGDYGLPVDYPAREAQVIDAMTIDRIQALAGRYMAPDQMTYVVVGDAASQRDRLEALKLGVPVAANALID